MGRPKTRLKCPICQKMKSPSECYLRPDGTIFRCKKCQSAYAKERYEKGKIKSKKKTILSRLGARKVERGTIQ